MNRVDHRMVWLQLRLAQFLNESGRKTHRSTFAKHERKWLQLTSLFHGTTTDSRDDTALHLDKILDR